MQWTAAILAGGRARRFGGRDKSGLVVDGRSILERQLDELARVARDIVVVRGADAPLAGGTTAGGSGPASPCEWSPTGCRTAGRSAGCTRR